MKETSSSKRGVVVGIFIFVGLLIFATAILVLGGQRKTFISSIQVKSMFPDVGGLNKGDNIWYAGVKVGTIQKISFLADQKIEVLMNIEKSSVPFIHKDVLAKISSDGLVGNKIIALAGGTLTAPPIEDGDVIAIAQTISTDEMMNTLQVNNKNLVEITGNLKDVTKSIVDGQGTLGRIIKDSAIYKDLNQTMITLRKTMSHTERLAEGLADYANKLQTDGSLANDLITDTVVFNNLRKTTTALQEASSQANVMVKNLQEASADVSTQLSSPNSPAGVLLHDEATAERLKETISNLASTTEKLDVNMEAVRHNFLFRGYFRKQEKAERKRERDSLRNLK